LVTETSTGITSKQRSKLSHHLGAKKTTKKEHILKLYKQGIKDVAEIANQTSTRTSYVSYVLSKAGLLEGYFDLYTTTAKEQNAHSRYFRNILAFKDEQTAHISIERIDELYRHFEQLGDRAGQHQAMVVALTGMNRARWSGKAREADIFRRWLHRH
jgi:transcription elongation factor GreA-like protein